MPLLIGLILVFMFLLGSKKGAAKTLNQINNPFRIVYDTANDWQGQQGFTQVDDLRFCNFDTLSNGIRAGLKLLNTYYYQHKLNTIRSIVNRYDKNAAPGYAVYVSDITKLGIDQVFSWNKENISKIAWAITGFETGKLQPEIEILILDEYERLYNSQVSPPPPSEGKGGEPLPINKNQVVVLPAGSISRLMSFN